MQDALTELCVPVNGGLGVQGRYRMRKALDRLSFVEKVLLRPGYAFRVLVRGDVGTAVFAIRQIHGAKDIHRLGLIRKRHAFADGRCPLCDGSDLEEHSHD